MVNWYQWSAVQTGLNLRNHSTIFLESQFNVTHNSSKMCFHRFHSRFPQSTKMRVTLWDETPLNLIGCTELSDLLDSVLIRQEVTHIF